MMRSFVLLGVGLALAATSANAQSRQSAIPREELPPRGLCRVWLDDRPVWRQPAPTDCATARRSAPPHSRVIHTESNGRVTILPRIASDDRYYDRRADPRSPYYDARYDRNSRHYDHRLASRDRDYESRDRDDDDREKWERRREHERRREQERLRREWERERRERDGVYRSRVNSDSRN